VSSVCAFHITGAALSEAVFVITVALALPFMSETPPEEASTEITPKLPVFQAGFSATRTATMFEDWSTALVMCQPGMEKSLVVTEPGWRRSEK